MNGRVIAWGFCILALGLSAIGCSDDLREPNRAAAEALAIARGAQSGGDWALALKQLSIAVEADASSPYPLLARGELHRRMGLFAAAVQDFEVASERAPDSPLPRLALAALYRGTGRPDIAAHAVDEARKLDSRDPGVLLETGREKLAAGEVFSAALALGESIRTRNDVAEPFVLLGVLELGREAFGEAENSLKRALELEPGHPAALLQLGRLYRVRYRAPEARKTLMSAIEADPSSADARRELSELLRAMGRADEADAMAQDADEVAERTERIDALRARLWEQPQRASLRAELVAALIAGDRFAEAAEAAHGWLSFASDDVEAWRWLGRARLASGDFDGARRAFQDVVSRAPMDVEAQDVLGSGSESPTP